MGGLAEIICRMIEFSAGIFLAFLPHNMGIAVIQIVKKS
jgi:hypothetical protein